MRAIWMGISPGPEWTRVLVQDGPEQTLLKARLPHSPQHPRAVATLCEAVALWCGRPVRAALAADGPGTFCATTPWLDTFDAVTRSPLFQIEFVSRARPPREREGLDGLGDFRDLRQLILVGVAR
jgi:hypothetical protein